MPFIHIYSSKFPIQNEDSSKHDSEGVYGKALADYLAEKLQGIGYVIPYVCREDWGWWVEITGQVFSLGCCVYGASDAGGKPELCVKISRGAERKWSFIRLRMIDTRPRVEQLFDDLNSIFESDVDIKVVGFSEEFPLWN